MDLRPRLKLLYRHYRDSALNRDYYGCKLEKTRRLNKALEIVVAIGSSTAIGSWVIFKNQSGEVIWAVIAGITTIVTVIKPILDLPKEIERYSKLFLGHGDVYYDLDKIVIDVRLLQDFPDELFARYQSVLKRRDSLAPDDDPNPDEELLKRLTDAVNKRIPASSLWMPPKTDK